MSLNSNPSSAINHLYNESNFTNLPNSSDEPHGRPSIFMNVQPGVSEPIFTPNVFALTPFAPMVVQPDGTPWKCPEWMSNDAHTGLTQFNSIHRPFKRKSSEDTSSFIKSKQLITEEKMAAHLNGLHLSSDYTSHSNDASTSQLNPSRLEQIDDLRIDTSDLEEKLRRAQRITICEEVRKLREQPILPKAILERYEKPCTALVLWQPPERVTELIQEKDRLNDNNQSDDEENNLMEMNSEASMDLDL